MDIVMRPKDTLDQGCRILADVLGPHGFRFEFGGDGTGSGGAFAWGKFVRSDRGLELHFRRSLGLVTYHAGHLALGHRPYMEALGRAREARYPGVSDDPLDGFRDLASDLADLAGPDFLEGPADILRRAAEMVEAEAPQRQREYMAWAVGDVERRDKARALFHAGDFVGTRSLLEALRYPDLATEAEREMLRLARARAG
ncbi:MAG TPA: hypothetical protein VIJ16_04160 [Gemmatimonadaceae bacterium]